MNKQRFSVVYEKFTSKDIIPKGIMDNKKNNHMCRIEEVCGLLNEQQATIEMYQRRVHKREEQISIIKKYCIKFLTDEQFETIRKELENG